MKIDQLTKAALCTIALSLGVLAINSIGWRPASTTQAAPATQAAAAKNTGHFQFAATDDFTSFFNPETGDVWQFRKVPKRAKEGGFVKNPDGTQARTLLTYHYHFDGTTLEFVERTEKDSK